MWNPSVILILKEGWSLVRGSFTCKCKGKGVKNKKWSFQCFLWVQVSLVMPTCQDEVQLLKVSGATLQLLLQLCPMRPFSSKTLYSSHQDTSKTLCQMLQMCMHAPRPVCTCWELSGFPYDISEVSYYICDTLLNC